MGLPRAGPGALEGLPCSGAPSVGMGAWESRSDKPNKKPLPGRSGLGTGFAVVIESERQDLNLRPPLPQSGALPSCATPRQNEVITAPIPGPGAGFELAALPRRHAQLRRNQAGRLWSHCSLFNSRIVSRSRRRLA